jgi:predicted amino acid dehydrogenase
VGRAIAKPTIITITLKTGMAYAKSLGKQYLVLVEPLEHLVKIYERHGFTLKTAKNYPKSYCIKEVSYDD